MIDDDTLLRHLRELRATAPARFKQVIEGKREQVVAWRDDEGPAWRPPWTMARHGTPEEPVPDPEYDGASVQRVGFDAHGRPVISELSDEDEPWILQVWEHHETYSDRFEGASVTRLLRRDGRICAAVEAWEGAATIERWEFPDDARAHGVEVSISRRRFEARRYVAILSDEGDLARIDAGYEEGRREPDDEQALRDGLALAATLETTWSTTPETWADRQAREAALASDYQQPRDPLGWTPRTPEDVHRALVDVGLGVHADRLVREAVVPGFRLAADPAAASRLHGPGLLPPETSWPRNEHGRPLTFVAGIDLAEIPLPTPLPAGGWLLFFADLGTDDDLGLVEESGVREGDPACLFFTDTPVTAEGPPDVPACQPEGRVRPVPAIGLPDDYEAAARLGLTAEEGAAYAVVTDALREPRAHGLLTPWSGTQSHPPDADSVLLLHLEPGAEFGFDFLDTGTLQFRIQADALARRAWDEAFAVPESA